MLEYHANYLPRADDLSNEYSVVGKSRYIYMYHDFNHKKLT